jgi:hypothetical protein
VQYQRQGPPSRGHLYQAFGVKEIRHAWEKNNGPLKNSTQFDIPRDGYGECPDLPILGDVK